jgi:hypothetical protein
MVGASTSRFFTKPMLEQGSDYIVPLIAAEGYETRHTRQQQARMICTTARHSSAVSAKLAACTACRSELARSLAPGM